MKLLWCSDIHLNFLPKKNRKQFYYKINRKKADAIVISGDIAESHNMVQLVTEMRETCKIPIYFVMGNHDYYGSSIALVRKAAAVTGECLSSMNHAHLSETTALTGVDGWGDCRNGDYENSRLQMSDWHYIDDLREARILNHTQELVKGKPFIDHLKVKLQELADADAFALTEKVRNIIADGYTKVIIVTHVPAFEDACLYAGTKSTPSGLPFFSSRILGEAMLPLVDKHSEVDFLWLSGHTHARACLKPRDNLTVKVAEASYYFPKIEEIIEL